MSLSFFSFECLFLFFICCFRFVLISTVCIVSLIVFSVYLLSFSGPDVFSLGACVCVCVCCTSKKNCCWLDACFLYNTFYTALRATQNRRRNLTQKLAISDMYISFWTVFDQAAFHISSHDPSTTKKSNTQIHIQQAHMDENLPNIPNIVLKM